MSTGNTPNNQEGSKANVTKKIKARLKQGQDPSRLKIAGRLKTPKLAAKNQFLKRIVYPKWSPVIKSLWAKGILSQGSIKDGKSVLKIYF